MSGANTLMANGDPIPPATQDEQEAIWEQFDRFITTRGSHKPGCGLHLPDGDEPQCDTHVASSNRWTTKPSAVYPVGYRDVCRRCLADWRERETEGSA